MQLFKHMEVILMLAFGIVCATVALAPTASAPRAPADGADAAVMTLPAMPTMPTVHIVGHRLTPAQKRAGDDAAG